MKDAVIRARCSSILKQRVLGLASRLGLEEADIVRVAVTDYLNRTESNTGPTTLTLHAPVEVMHELAKPDSNEAQLDAALSSASKKSSPGHRQPQDPIEHELRAVIRGAAKARKRVSRSGSK